MKRVHKLSNYGIVLIRVYLVSPMDLHEIISIHICFYKYKCGKFIT